jgi:hypothetical protein
MGFFFLLETTLNQSFTIEDLMSTGRQTTFIAGTDKL